jgi:neutral ceramidase
MIRGFFKTSFVVLAWSGVMACALAAPSADAAEPTWKAGLARAVITPPTPMLMGGYADRPESTGVVADIEAKALALEDPRGRQALLLTADLIGFETPIARRLAEEIERTTGLKRNQILLIASHSHAGPLLTLDEHPRPSAMITTKLRPQPPEKHEVALRYTEKLIAALGRISADAMKDLKPARLSWGKGRVNFPWNRRYEKREGETDPTVPLLRIDAADGQLRGAVFQCACHPNALKGKNREICGDYAGFAQIAIEKKHPGAQAMFTIGCAGDTVPNPRDSMQYARTYGAELADEVEHILAGNLEPVRGNLQTELDWVDLPLQPMNREQLQKRAKGDRSQGYCAVRMLAALDRGETLPAAYRAPIALWQVGDKLTWISLPGEVVHGYVPDLERDLGPDDLWISAYANDYLGYVPTARVLAEGGYEIRGLFYHAGYFSPDVEKTIVAACRALAERAGRKPPQRTSGE